MNGVCRLLLGFFFCPDFFKTQSSLRAAKGTSLLDFVFIL
jgi:hypothetical protein